ncbi:calcium-binding protein [Mariniblastus fucicola]|uniref:Bifunctional hemolysin/adenylate cyclase n=1 Tax=Mariniblastus fucicola TaxID=980251 RepID=A0A5B9PA78_9BACT|nr:calcium-binding protein [Mariniblastus fucicola]QEG22399.1 Bifunctional hemolysin/adenylate cyclase precursor [Mariniblastus fucicola]
MKNLIQHCIKSFTATSFFSRRSAVKPRRAKKSSLSFNSLEPRNLLATLSLDAGVLTINGTNDRDFVVLIQNNDGTFDLDDAGTITVYNNDDVDNVVFRGKNGNDEFINNTFETSTFYGHGGDDVFYGGVSVDIAYGGGDNDELHGGIGDDFLYGSDGDDSIYGEEGNDTVYAGNGDDRIYGGDGDDFLSAEAGDDVMFGGNGDDFLRGYNGNDEISGDDGDDLVYGQGGDDLIFGNDGHDRLRGNNDNDTIYGQLGNDVLIGDVGDDIFYGGDGNEIIYGWLGNDIMYGENGDDALYDAGGDDELYGGNGNDILRAGDGHDTLRGGDGSDTLRGEAGNDRLYGGALLDRLYAGGGDDSLHGGEGVEVDQLYGQSGSDRFHEDDGDFIGDRVAEDVTIRYETDAASWHDMEIEVLDRSFQQMYDLAGSNVLLRETYSVGDDVTIYKYQDLPGDTTSQNIINPTTGKREIHIVDFDETTDIGQTFFQAEITRQFGYNWDSPEELGTVIQDAASQWQAFLDLSSWTQVDPQDPNFFESGDGEWWYDGKANFTTFGAKHNPYEDFNGIWGVTVSQSFSNGLLSKVNWLTSVVQSM